MTTFWDQLKRGDPHALLQALSHPTLHQEDGEWDDTVLRTTFRIGETTSSPFPILTHDPSKPGHREKMEMSLEMDPHNHYLPRMEYIPKEIDGRYDGEWILVETESSRRWEEKAFFSLIEPKIHEGVVVVMVTSRTFDLWKTLAPYFFVQDYRLCFIVYSGSYNVREMHDLFRLEEDHPERVIFFNLDRPTLMRDPRTGVEIPGVRNTAEFLTPDIWDKMTTKRRECFERFLYLFNADLVRPGKLLKNPEEEKELLALYQERNYPAYVQRLREEIARRPEAFNAEKVHKFSGVIANLHHDAPIADTYLYLVRLILYHGEPGDLQLVPGRWKFRDSKAVIEKGGDVVTGFDLIVGDPASWVGFFRLALEGILLTEK